LQNSAKNCINNHLHAWLFIYGSKRVRPASPRFPSIFTADRFKKIRANAENSWAQSVSRKIRSYFLLPLAKWLTDPKKDWVATGTYFERVERPPFLFVSPFYLPTYLQSYVGCTYVLNSDEGLTERALVFKIVYCPIRVKLRWNMVGCVFTVPVYILGPCFYLACFFICFTAKETVLWNLYSYAKFCKSPQYITETAKSQKPNKWRATCLKIKNI
jgi:hypothetical protein